jgi:arabinofuranosyltransferase
VNDLAQPKRVSYGLLGALMVVLGSLLVWWMLGRPSTGIDDADIFLVYARNFSEGQGWVYNIGGERVEGFTSMFWVLICSGFFRLFESPEIQLFMLNVLFGILTVVACLRRLQRPGLFIMLFASAPAWFAWCQVTLMESGLWCLLLTALVLAVVERRSWSVAALLPLLVFTRPESMLWCAWGILILGIATALSSGRRSGLKAMILPIITFGLALAVLVGFRLSYFGYPVPNTYYAKVSTDWDSNCFTGMVYLFRYAISNLSVFLVLVTLAVVLVVGLWRRKHISERSLFTALCLLPGIGIPVLVGGDHFGGFRFYQPIWPILCLLAAWELPRWLDRFPLWVSRGLPFGLLLLGWVFFPFTANMRHEFRIAQKGRDTGAALTEMFKAQPNYPAVAVITAGGFKLAYAGRVDDLMGLNSVEMAHASETRTGFRNHAGFNRDVFYRWYPDLLLCGDSIQFDTMVLNGLQQEEAFNSLYLKRTVRWQDQVITAYFARRFLATLPDAGNATGEGDLKIDVTQPVETEL